MTWNACIVSVNFYDSEQNSPDPEIHKIRSAMFAISAAVLE